MRASDIRWHLLAAALLAGCGGAEPSPPPRPAVDLLRQADAASEMVDAGLLSRHTARLLAGGDAVPYLRSELWRIGLVAGGPTGDWEQRFENRRRLAHPSGAWVLQRGEARATLGSRDMVTALGGRGGTVRLRGLQAVFVAPTLAAPPGALAAKVVVVLDPTGTAMAAGTGSPLRDLLRRAAAAGVHAVLVLPRPGSAAALPAPARAAELAAGSGVAAVVWLDELAARALVKVGLDTPLEWLPRLEWRADLLPLSMGTLQGEVAGHLDREPHSNLVALIPGRAGGDEEAVAVLATLPSRQARATPAPALSGGEAPAGAAAADSRAQAAAAAELLAVATAFQALSDPPRRTVIFAFTDPGEDGTAGARQLLADRRWPPARVAAALVLAGGNLSAPTQDLTFVGAQASPLYGMTARLAARQGRRVGGDWAPGRGAMWRSPAWPLIQAGVPTALLEPGRLPRRLFAGVEAGAMAPVAATGDLAPLAGMVEDARLAFRLALELAEGGRPPRVDPARVEAVLRRLAPAPPPVAAPRPRSVRAALPAAGLDAASVGASAATAGGEGAAPGATVGAQGAQLSSAPAFAAPPPEGEAPAAEVPAPPEPPPAAAPAVPSPTPPQR